MEKRRGKSVRIYADKVAKLKDDQLYTSIQIAKITGCSSSRIRQASYRRQLIPVDIRPSRGKYKICYLYQGRDVKAYLTTHSIIVERVRRPRGNSWQRQQAFALQNPTLMNPGEPVPYEAPKAKRPWWAFWRAA